MIDTELNGNMLNINDLNKKAVVVENYVNIASGDDMQTYIAPGSYLCHSNAIARSLTNCPLDTAFLLYVNNVGGRDILQTFCEWRGSKTVKRAYEPYTGIWSDEYSYLKTSDLRFVKDILEWGSYSNGTYQLKRSILEIPIIIIIIGPHGRLSAFWGHSQVEDDRSIITPEGMLTVHLDSETQITVSGATSNWSLRGIMTI